MSMEGFLLASRFFDLRNKAARDAAKNGRTLVFDRDQLLALNESRVSCEVAFVSHYEAIRALCGELDRPGLAMFAIDEDGIAARAVLPAGKSRVRAAIVGRHSRSDVWLGDDSAVALRHLAVVVYPYAAGDALRYRVVDLRTQMGFTDERQVPLEAFEADGPVFIELGRYVLLFLTLETGQTWPVDAMQAWQSLPKREYRGEPKGVVPRRGRRLVSQRDATATGVQLLPGPINVRRELVSGDDVPVGELTVKSDDGEVKLLLGESSLRLGVLLGRYDRCDNGGLPVLSNKDISRVHLLLTEVDGVIYAIDTASTNGVWHGRTEVRLHRVNFGDTLELGHGLAWVTVSPVH